IGKMQVFPGTLPGMTDDAIGYPLVRVHIDPTHIMRLYENFLIPEEDLRDFTKRILFIQWQKDKFNLIRIDPANVLKSLRIDLNRVSLDSVDRLDKLVCPE